MKVRLFLLMVSIMIATQSFAKIDSENVGRKAFQVSQNSLVGADYQKGLNDCNQKWFAAERAGKTATEALNIRAKCIDDLTPKIIPPKINMVSIEGAKSEGGVN